MSRVMLLPPVCPEVHQCAARAHFGLRQRRLGQCGRCHKQVGKGNARLLEAEFEVLFDRGAGHDVEELPCHLRAGHSYGVGMQGIVYLVFLWGYVEHAHVGVVCSEVFVGDGVYQFGGDDALFVERAAHGVAYRAQRLPADAGVHLCYGVSQLFFQPAFEAGQRVGCLVYVVDVAFMDEGGGIFPGVCQDFDASVTVLPSGDAGGFG